MDKHEPARQMAPPHGGVGGWGPPRTKRDSELENMKGQKLPGGGGPRPGPGPQAPAGPLRQKSTQLLIAVRVVSLSPTLGLEMMKNEGTNSQ